MWEIRYEIGHDQIDSQHKQLILTLDVLLKALNHPEEAGLKQVSADTVRFVKNYAVVHMRSEEMYQAAVGFSEAKEHKKMHDAFLIEVQEEELELIRTDYELAAVKKMADYLTKWLLFHILKEDKKMIDPSYFAGGVLPCTSCDQT